MENVTHPAVFLRMTMLVTTDQQAFACRCFGMSKMWPVPAVGDFVIANMMEEEGLCPFSVLWHLVLLPTTSIGQVKEFDEPLPTPKSKAKDVIGTCVFTFIINSIGNQQLLPPPANKALSGPGPKGAILSLPHYRLKGRMGAKNF